MGEDKETTDNFNDFNNNMLAFMLSMIGQPKQTDFVKRVDYLEAKVNMLEQFVIANTVK